MKPLTPEDLCSLEQYDRMRDEFRRRLMAHRAARRLALGEHVTLHFEDRLTIQYQVQEMLRAERIFEAAGIQEELDAYNPLIPEGRNWKATMMIEYPDPEQRRQALARLIGIERRVWLAVAGEERIYPVADEDLERETEEKTSSVHFLRFELPAAAIRRLREGAPLSAGIDHPEYQVVVEPLEESLRRQLLADLD